MSCDWDISVRDDHYSVTVAMEIVDHPSCEEKAEVKKKNFDVHDCMGLFLEEEELGAEDEWCVGVGGRVFS